jgi:hypothetical protein
VVAAEQQREIAVTLKVMQGQRNQAEPLH